MTKFIDEIRGALVDSVSHSLKERFDARNNALVNKKLASEYELLAKAHEKQAQESIQFLAKLSKYEELIQKKLKAQK
jgi:hypothetical protein